MLTYCSTKKGRLLRQCAHVQIPCSRRNMPFKPCYSALAVLTVARASSNQPEVNFEGARRPEPTPSHFASLCSLPEEPSFSRFRSEPRHSTLPSAKRVIKCLVLAVLPTVAARARFLGEFPIGRPRLFGDHITHGMVQVRVVQSEGMPGELDWYSLGAPRKH